MRPFFYLRHMKFLCLAFIFTLVACSRIPFLGSRLQDPPQHLGKYERYESQDYLTQFREVGKIYLSTPGVEEYELSPREEAYFASLYKRILTNNELLLNRSLEPRFHIIKDQAPFIFSLPPRDFFLSSGLLSKYCRSEDILFSSLTHEIIKLHRSLYPRTTIVPIGYIKTDRLLTLVRVPSETKITLNKWSFYAMRRAGLDGYAYLNWLQLQNKNVLDFGMMLGDTRSISHEEFVFKNFIVQEGFVLHNIKKLETNSSPEFYNVINSLEKAKVKTWKSKRS